MAPYSSNRLLASLTEGSRNHLLARCESVLLEQRTIIHVEEETPPYAYFLESGFASVVATMQGGETAEVEMIGSEGVVGAFGLLGPSNIPIPTRCFIQMSAEARRIPMGELRKAFEGIPEVRERVSSFFQAELATLMQIAGCHRVHEAEQRLSRWMLMAHDRVGGDTLRLTQEFLAEMLGTRRTTVTEVAGSLQRQGYIEYQRGVVRIVDRAGLESAACDCYNIVRRIYQNIYT